ncbi:hypothetical protein K6V98_05205 [Collinsella sp. AGMB00827]|uniref:PH domain-containing protein n=1 Tax=Collinsella ureilytica TaxID=2869515 RepID=A0ABS7ML29_9ACTN|nr:hypothetical protein [Collinsella urealyticum]MBY4797753.1 hypothetical protein [Collinsella urealyticum]
MKRYSYIRRYFVIEVLLTGLLSGAVVVVAPILAYRGFYPGIMLVLMVPAVYQLWNTFIAISNPQTVALDEEAIEFSAWGRTDHWELAQIQSFRVREFPSAGKMYIRINGGGMLRGRYWLQTRVMTEGRELFQKICDLEYKMHPNTLKAYARRTSSVQKRTNPKAKAKDTQAQTAKAQPHI